MEGNSLVIPLNFRVKGNYSPTNAMEYKEINRHDTLYDAAPETALINIEEHSYITFTKHFKYLGIYC